MSFGHIKNMDCHTEDIKNEGGKYQVVQRGQRPLQTSFSFGLNTCLTSSITTPRFSDKNRFTSSRPDAVLAPVSAKTKKQQTSNEGGWFL